MAVAPSMTSSVASAASAIDLRALDDPLNQSAFTTWKQGQGGDREATSQFRLSGMYCAACAGLIEPALRGRRRRAARPAVSRPPRCALVRWDPRRTRPSALVEAVQRAGYDAVPDAAPARGRSARPSSARRCGACSWPASA